jgi:hypothetical protein
MKTGFTMNGGIVNWPEIKTRPIRRNGLADPMQTAPNQDRSASVLHLFATNLERIKKQVIQIFGRL